MKHQVYRGDDGRVSFAELFYDLVFVFAITQVSHHLLAHLDLKGALETAFMFAAIWWTWIYSTWVFNRLDPEVPPVRILLFTMMAGGLFLSMSIPDAFGERAWVFALAYVGMHLVRSGYVLFNSEPGTDLRLTYWRITIWFFIASLFWLGGVFLFPDQQVAFWVVALAIEYLGPVVGYWLPGLDRSTSDKWDVKGGHMAERCGLFVIICLGELLLISGATFAELPWDGYGLLAFASALLGSIGMWWVYFDIGHKRGAHHIEHSADPGALARLAYTYQHIPIVAGVVLSAAGAELAIAHPHDPASTAKTAVIVGSTALYLFGNGIFKRVSANNFPLSHYVGLGLCALLALASPWLELAVLNMAAAVVLIAVAVWENRSIGHHVRR